MADMMRAARFHTAKDIRIDTIPRPTPKEGEVIVEIEWCGICGTDLHEYLLGPLVIPTHQHPHPLTGEHIPVVMGHEFVGRIADASQLGPSQPTESGKLRGKQRLKVGDKVIADPRLNCRECYECTHGNDNLCVNWGFLGLSGGGGGFCERVAVKEEMCYVVPEEVDLRDAVIIEPLVVGRHALAVAGVDNWRDVSVLVVGGGPVGLSVLWNLRVVGVGRVYVSEPTKTRRDMVAELADDVFDPSKENVAEECRERTLGRGVDAVFDCAGVPVGMRAGMDAVRRKGVYVNVAGWEQPFTLPMEFWMLREVTLKASMAYDDDDFAAVVGDYVAGKFKGAERMITARIGLHDLQSRGFEELVTNRDLHSKIVATPKRDLQRTP